MPANDLSYTSLYWWLLWLLRLSLAGISLALLVISAKSLCRSLGGGKFGRGLNNPDLALEMLGADGDLTKLVAHSGHLPLLRNLSVDSRVFIPAYVLTLALASVLIIGLPFACACAPFKPWSAIAILLAILAAILDLRENTCLGKALHFNADGSEAALVRRNEMLGEGRRFATLKFVTLSIVLALLSWHAILPSGLVSPPEIGRHSLGSLFGLAALGMAFGRLLPRLLEPAVAIAGFAAVLLFTLSAWRI